MVGIEERPYTKNEKQSTPQSFLLVLVHLVRSVAFLSPLHFGIHAHVQTWLSREQEIDMVMAAAADTSLSGGVTTWYRCSNGHVFGVGNCGRLNGAGTCDECGVRIGGQGPY